MNIAKMSVKGPFRSKRGLLLGVVRGLAEHYGWSPAVLRLAIIGISFFLAFWPMILLYLAAAFVMPAEPAARPASDREREIVLLAQVDPATMVEALASRADALERKIRRLEDHVTSKAFRLG
ncbi:MAG: PspC domain-containing protein [Deltaproteobacteria bacterium]|jgi:phage shock protein C|nr:PspC domain-containing protein [Deltaproteobacteria bacterium]